MQTRQKTNGLRSSPLSVANGNQTSLQPVNSSLDISLSNENIQFDDVSLNIDQSLP